MIMKRHIMSIGPITDNIKFDHLAKIESAIFTHYKVATFPFVMNE